MGTAKAKSFWDPTQWDEEPVFDNYGSKMKYISKCIQPWLNRCLREKGFEVEWKLGFFVEEDLMRKQDWRMMDRTGLEDLGAWDEDMFKRKLGCRDHDGALAWMGHSGTRAHFLCVQTKERFLKNARIKEERAEAKFQRKLEPEEGSKEEAGASGKVTTYATGKKEDVLISQEKMKSVSGLRPGRPKGT